MKYKPCQSNILIACEVRLWHQEATDTGEELV